MFVVFEGSGCMISWLPGGMVSFNSAMRELGQLVSTGRWYGCHKFFWQGVNKSVQLRMNLSGSVSELPGGMVTTRVFGKV